VFLVSSDAIVEVAIRCEVSVFIQNFGWQCLIQNIQNIHHVGISVVSALREPNIMSHGTHVCFCINFRSRDVLSINYNITPVIMR
jgi:hypothetical protein